jgi:hypothetical protein
LTFAGKRTRISKGQGITETTGTQAPVSLPQESLALCVGEHTHREAGHGHDAQVPAQFPRRQTRSERFRRCARQVGEGHCLLFPPWSNAWPQKNQRASSAVVPDAEALGRSNAGIGNAASRSATGSFLTREMQPRKGTPPRQKRRQYLAGRCLPPGAGKICLCTLQSPRRVQPVG